MIKLFDMSLFQEDDIDMGKTCRGDTLVSPTGKGVFSGEKLNGELVPVGMGVTYTPYPGKNDIESTMLLITDDGAHILMDMNAYFDIDADKEKRLMDGESLSPDEYYYKGVVSFKTNHETYKWLERKVCVSTLVIDNWEKVDMTVYMV